MTYDRNGQDQPPYPAQPTQPPGQPWPGQPNPVPYGQAGPAGGYARPQPPYPHAGQPAYGLPGATPPPGQVPYGQPPYGPPAGGYPQPTYGQSPYGQAQGYVPPPIQHIPQREMARRSGRQAMVAGGALFGIGLAITVITYAIASNDGGTYFVSFGPMLAGAFLFIRGLIGFSKNS